jgi:serpin B
VARVVMADGSEAGGPRIVFADASLKLKPAFEEVAVGE